MEIVRLLTAERIKRELYLFELKFQLVKFTTRKELVPPEM